MPVDEQAHGVRIHLAAILHEVFDISASVKTKAQPLLQYILRMNGLLECSIGVPLFQQDPIGLCEYCPKLVLPVVIR